MQISLPLYHNTNLHIPGKVQVQLVHSGNGHIHLVLESVIYHLQGKHMWLQLLGAEYGYCHHEKTPFLLLHKVHSANTNISFRTIMYDYRV